MNNFQSLILIHIKYMYMHFSVRRNHTSGEWPVSDTFSSKSNLDIGELPKTTYTDVEHATDLTFYT